MTAGYFDITVEQGATFAESFLIKDALGNILDLTGCTATMQIRAALGMPAIVSLTNGNGGLVLGGTNGTITPAFVTAPLNAGRYVYDLKLYDSGGNPYRLLQGFVCISAEVTLL
jgi:hypothetical protein